MASVQNLGDIVSDGEWDSCEDFVVSDGEQEEQEERKPFEVEVKGMKMTMNGNSHSPTSKETGGIDGGEEVARDGEGIQIQESLVVDRVNEHSFMNDVKALSCVEGVSYHDKDDDAKNHSRCNVVDVKRKGIEFRRLEVENGESGIAKAMCEGGEGRVAVQIGGVVEYWNGADALRYLATGKVPGSQSGALALPSWFFGGGVMRNDEFGGSHELNGGGEGMSSNVYGTLREAIARGRRRGRRRSPSSSGVRGAVKGRSVRSAFERIVSRGASVGVGVVSMRIGVVSAIGGVGKSEMIAMWRGGRFDGHGAKYSPTVVESTEGRVEVNGDRYWVEVVEFGGQGQLHGNAGVAGALKLNAERIDGWVWMYRVEQAESLDGLEGLIDNFGRDKPGVLVGLSWGGGDGGMSEVTAASGTKPNSFVSERVDPVSFERAKRLGRGAGLERTVEVQFGDGDGRRDGGSSSAEQVSSVFEVVAQAVILSRKRESLK